MAAKLILYSESHSSPCKILSTNRFNLLPRIAILHLPLQGTRSPIPRASRAFSSPYRSPRRGGQPDIVTGDYDVDEDDDEEDEEEEDRSLDLLVKLVQNVFRNVSRKARKAVRSVLPVSFPSQLVGFSVNGLVILTFLWVLKAFLEVICTLGSVVFASILLIRGTWMCIMYLQGRSNYRIDEGDDEHNAWSGAQPAN
ncbi:unnamed protein product [Cuscuta europaea]|uniref:Protein SHORT HYPOCOTYL IN WHITE LIGHT 1 n=1 Tax=Cuscuta europaea TaxID=41803 RepID=A0A9P0Z053_CUSEU|nr:unnamed protein product [Cuscuta europaea]